MIERIQDFEEIIYVDFEYYCPDGETPIPTCMSARELHSGRHFLMWADELRSLDEAPFRTDPRALMVCFSASAELSCFHALQWPEPHHLCDLFLEERCIENGAIRNNKAWGLTAVMKRYGLDAMSSSEKEGNRQLAMRNVPEEFNKCEKRILLDYVSEDTLALQKLFPKMLPRIKHHSLMHFRSGYAKAVARTEFLGIPLNPKIDILKERWPIVLEKLVADVDKKYGFFTGMKFNEDAFADYVEDREINWPVTETSGKYKLDKDTLSSMCDAHLNYWISKNCGKTLVDREIKITYGSDYRNAVR